MLACLRKLGTARPLDDIDDSAQMASETLRQYFRKFNECLIELYGGRFLNRRPSTSELVDIERRYCLAGFPGSVGAVDCCKIIWKNCPHAHKGQYHNTKEGKLATIQVEAWCDRDLYVWHWFPGRCGTNNDKTMLAASPLFIDILNGTYKFRLFAPYRIFGSTSPRELPYFFADGIYPNWPLFAKPIHQPSNDAESKYTKLQEGVRKDIERCFGVLQARFFILRRESYQWYKDDIINISYSCVILHNMLVRMNQSGAFTEDEAEEGQLIDVICEMYDHEEYNANISSMQTESHQLVRQQEIESNRYDWESISLTEQFMTTESAFLSLKRDLIRGINRSD